MTEERKGGRKPRGFAAMDPEMLRGIAAQGGRAAHAMGKAHRFDSQEAKLAAAKRHAARPGKDEGGADQNVDRDRETATAEVHAGDDRKS
jgi:general stress protein YciG